MGQRICGDAFLLRINQLQCQPEHDENRLYNVVYEDVPVGLVGSSLLEEIMRPEEWMTLPGANIVRLGLVKAQEQAQQREWEESIASEQQFAADDLVGLPYR